jgi:hypothetical protein
VNTPQGTTIYSALGGTGAALLSNKLTAITAAATASAAGTDAPAGGISATFIIK